MAGTMESKLIDLRRTYQSEINKSPIDLTAATKARQDIIDFIKANRDPAKLSEAALAGAHAHLNIDAGKLGLAVSPLISLGVDDKGNEVFWSAKGRFYTDEEIKAIERKMAKDKNEQAQIRNGPELLKKGDKVEKYDAAFASEDEKSQRKILAERSKKSRLISAAVLGGALVVAAVSGGLAIPALVGVGGAVVGLGSGAAAVITGLGVTGVSSLVAVGAGTVWATREWRNSRDPEVMKTKYRIEHDRHVRRMKKLEKSLDEIKDKSYTNPKKLNKLKAKLSKEFEKGIAIDQKYSMKFNKHFAKLEKGGVITDWLSDHVGAFSEAHERRFKNFMLLRDAANLNIASNMCEAARLNQEYGLDLQRGENFQQIIAGEETAGFRKKQTFKRSEGEYSDIQTRVIEQFMEANRESYQDMLSWGEVKNQLIKDCGIEAMKDLPPKMEARMIIGLLADGKVSDSLKKDVTKVLTGINMKDGLLKEAVDAMKKDGLYDENVATFIKDNEDLLVGPEVKVTDLGYEIFEDPGEFTEKAPAVVKKPVKRYKNPTPENIAKHTARVAEYNEYLKKKEAWEKRRDAHYDKKTKYEEMKIAHPTYEEDIKTHKAQEAEHKEWEERKANYDKELKEAEKLKPKEDTKKLTDAERVSIVAEHEAEAGRAAGA